jgi:hypothetical protein
MTTANESLQEEGIVRLANIAAQAVEVIGEHIKNHEDYESRGGQIADLALAELKHLIEQEVSQAIIQALAQAIEKDRQELLKEIHNRMDEAVTQARDRLEKDAEPLRREMRESREETRKAASTLLRAYQDHAATTEVLTEAYRNATDHSERLHKSAAELLEQAAQARRKDQAEQRELVKDLVEAGKREAVNEARLAATETLRQAEARTQEETEKAVQKAEDSAREMEARARRYAIAAGAAAGTALAVAGAALATAVLAITQLL